MAVATESRPVGRARGAIQRQAVELERHEAKYLVPPALIPEIREFIRPFVYADPNAHGDPPGYTVTTVQLDTPDLSLYRAKEREALHRFKLRVRSYGGSPDGVVFLEVKRKIRGMILKSRAAIPGPSYSAATCLDLSGGLHFRSPEEEASYLNFVRLVKITGARPVMRIRYYRESYLGAYDNYSRITFDSRLQYQPTRSWYVHEPGGRWWCMDSTTSLNTTFPGAVLELKTFSDAPLWMIDLARRFNLTRIGFCKYFTAMRMELLFSGHAYSQASEPCEDDD
jgi:hypothetical protein